MKRITITPTNPSDVRRWAADLADAESQPWIDREKANNSWGLPNRQVPDPNWTPGAGQTEADRPLISLPAEYTVSVTDIPDATWAAQKLTASRAAGVESFNADTPMARALRAIAVALYQESNRQRTWDRNLKTAASQSANYTTFQTAIAGLPATPVLLPDDVKDWITAAMTGGQAD